MRVLAHPDPWVLETELLDRVAAARTGDPMAPILIIVPTRRLADHVARRLAERFDAVLGIEILVHRALSGRIVAWRTGSSPQMTDRALLEALLQSILKTLDRNPLATFARSSPGAAGSILESLRSLREAGIAPDSAAALLRDDPEAALAAIYARYAAELERLRLWDDAALAAAAVPHATAWARRFRAAFHHGAYELIGSNLELLRAIDRGTDVSFLLPHAPDAPAYRYAEAFASRHLLGDGAAIEPLADREGGLLGSRLAALYDEAARPDAIPPESVAAIDAPGHAAEIDAVTRTALRDALVHGPGGVAIAARALAPYAEPIDALLDRGDRVWSPAIDPPLRREPRAHRLLGLLRVVADRFPRAATAEILRSPIVRWDRLAPGDTPFDGTAAERWSRRAGILRGLDAWTKDLPAWAARPALGEDASDSDAEDARARAARRAAVAERIGRALAALDERVAPTRARGWAAHTAAIAALANELLVDASDDTDAETLDRAIAVLRERETALGEMTDVPFSTMLAFLEKVIDAAEAPRRNGADGGIAVLDLPQLRGLTFDVVHIVGLNAGQMPRPPREDPFLRDAARRALRDATGRPIGVKGEGADEERLLLALALGSARTALRVSWQRSDDTGRTRASSIALREIARLTLGRPDAAALRSGGRSIPAHPRDRLRAHATGPGLLRPGDLATLAALEGRADATTDPRPGRDLLRATESFDPRENAFDGRVGRPVLPSRGFSPTSLRTLGRCPLRYFFQYGLGVREMDDEADAFSVAAVEIGFEVHAVLERLYRELDGEGLFARGEADPLVTRAREIIDRYREEGALAGPARIAARLPVLGEVEAERWWGAIRAFVAADVARLAAERWRPVALESDRQGRIDRGGGRTIAIHGRLDRLLARPDGAVAIGDYKTSGRLAEHVSVTKLVRGEQMQAPLYRALAGGAVEFLGVGPTFAEAEEKEKHRAFERWPTGDVERGFIETLDVLVALAEEGRFPIRSGAWCRHCPYAAACRHGHPATIERHERAGDTRNFRALARKTKKCPRLADLEDAGGEDAEDET